MPSIGVDKGLASPRLDTDADYPDTREAPERVTRRYTDVLTVNGIRGGAGIL